MIPTASLAALLTTQLYHQEVKGKYEVYSKTDPNWKMVYDPSKSNRRYEVISKEGGVITWYLRSSVDDVCFAGEFWFVKNKKQPIGILEIKDYNCNGEDLRLINPTTGEEMKRLTTRGKKELKQTYHNIKKKLIIDEAHKYFLMHRGNSKKI